MKKEAKKFACVILAAGKGTRMRSTLPKVMHKIAGKPMLMHVVDTALAAHAEKVVVVTAPDMEAVRNEVKTRYNDAVHTVVQQKQLGTGDAVKAAESVLQGYTGSVLVLYGDTPLITGDTVLSMATLLEDASDMAVAVLAMEVLEPNAYGRLVVKNNNVERIVEVKDATAEEKNIALCNSGVMAVKANIVFKLLARLENKNASGEFYLTDLVKLARDEGHVCGFTVSSDTQEVMGVNARVELALAESIAQDKMRRKAMEQGATLIDPSSVYFAHDTKIGKDVIIHPNVVFGEKVEVKDNVEIRSFCHIDGAIIHERVVIGPFARVRPGSDIGESAHVGNFVELKNTKLEKGAKVNHLSYVGDAHVGEKANIGAGTITCNYDGVNKYKTVIGAHAFIGSNTALVAPVKIGDGAIIAAGSVITKDVAQDSLGIARANQQEKADWAKNKRKKK